MFKRVLSVILCIACILSVTPLSLFADGAQQPMADFVYPVTRCQAVPPGYVGIYDQQGLFDIEKDPDGLYILMCDIELSDTFRPICQSDNPFMGVLEGNGYRISGIDITSSGGQDDHFYLGLFSHIKDARISDLAVSGSIIHTDRADSYTPGKGAICVGGLAAHATGSISIINCVNEVDILVKESKTMNWRDELGTGGLIGYYRGLSGAIDIYFCRNTADVNGYATAGGILGIADLSHTDFNLFACENLGRVYEDCRDSDSAGIVARVNSEAGYNLLNVDSCHNAGTVIGNGSAGGIVSSSGARSNFTNCLNSGEVRDISKTPAAVYAAGIVTVTRNNTNISNCLNVGKVMGTARNSGDPDPYASAIITEMTSETNFTVTLSCCYWLKGTAETLYEVVDGDFYAPVNVQRGRISAEDMKKEETYEGFGFSHKWTMTEVYDYPYPTALFDPGFYNIYKERYVGAMQLFADDSYTYKQMFIGADEGGLAGVLGDTYDTSQSDLASGMWSMVQWAEAIAKWDFGDVETDYEILLAELIAGTYGESVREDLFIANLADHTSDAFASLAPFVGVEDATLLKSILEKLSELPSLAGADAAKLYEDAIKNVIAKIDFKAMSDTFGNLDTLISVGQAIAKGCENAEQLFNYYVICQAYADTVYEYCDVLTRTAEHCVQIDPKDGAEIKAEIDKFVAYTKSELENNPDAIYASTLSDTVWECATVVTVARVDDLIGMTNFGSIFKAIKAGVTAGAAFGDALTNMDSIVYNGRMLKMCGLISKGMYRTVTERRDAFAHTGDFDDGEALDYASRAYVALQMQACDYAMGYNSAISSAVIAGIIGGTRDEINSSVKVADLKAQLNEIINGRYICIGDDGYIGGFIARCPVTVTVTDKSGNEIARLATNEMKVARGYNGNYRLEMTGRDGKSGFYDLDDHTVSFTGEDEGGMELITYRAKSGSLIEILCYNDLPVKKGSVYTLSDGVLCDAQGTVTPDEEKRYAYNPFTDVEEDKWYYEGICYVAAAGYMSGVGNGLFKPNDPLTREQFMMILAQYADADIEKYKYMGHGMYDVATGAWYSGAVTWALKMGYTKGVGEHIFGLGQHITREQLATLFCRYAADIGIDVSGRADLDAYKDVSDISDWAKEGVAWAVDAGLITGTSQTDKYISPKMTATRAQAARMMQIFEQYCQANK